MTAIPGTNSKQKYLYISKILNHKHTEERRRRARKFFEKRKNDINTHTTIRLFVRPFARIAQTRPKEELKNDTTPE